MGTSQSEGRMEGWLHLIRSNRFGLQYSRKRYFVLDDHHLKSFKSVPTSSNEDPVRSAIIDSCIRVMDNGRESIHRKVLFIFTLYNTSNHNDQLKLGAHSPEEAARWIHSFQEAALKGGPAVLDNLVGCLQSRWPSFRLSGSSRINHCSSIDWALHSSSRMDPVTSDVIAPSSWTIFGCQNGLRLFKEAKDRDSRLKVGGIRMLGRVAALREMFRAKLGNYTSPDFSSGELTRNTRLNQIEGASRVDFRVPAGDGKTKENIAEEMEKTPSEHGSLVSLNDAADEFFDVPEPSDCDQSEYSQTSDFSPDIYSQDIRQPKLSTAAGLVKRLHDLAVHKRGYMDLQEMAREDCISCCYGTTLPKDPSCALACSWMAADPSTFLIRGPSYLDDHKKVKAKDTLMQMVAADWLKSDKREDDLAGRPGSIVQKYAAQGGPEFFFIVNIQVPGSTTYSLALYYMMNTAVADAPLLENFIKGDDAYRNSRFKLIPYISKGSWIVKQSVGKKACLIGQALEINYFHGKNYLELGIDIGSSTVARGVVSLVLGYLNNLVIEMAFLVQANTPEELPEYILGTCRLNHLDAAKAVLVKQ
ncbi:hypothetical protein I3843_13G099900 [Carya illinoinensis]|nr:hypothetical protein I3843_13G099900 [Carya illinoinensis]